MVALAQYRRHKTIPVRIGNVTIGGDAPIVVQSMTNTDTADINATFDQIVDLAAAGSEIIRVTVNTHDAARGVVAIREKMDAAGLYVPLVGCFHYNGHTLLDEISDLGTALHKYRINPGNVGFGKKRDRQFEMMIEQAITHKRAVRIGVNWGSLDQDLSARLMDENAALSTPMPSDFVMREALVQSALINAQKAMDIGLPDNQIILSAKVSRVQDLIAVYRALAARSQFALHLGLTEAGMGAKGIIATALGEGILLQDGIGDTIRASLTPEPGASRLEEVRTCQQILQALDLRSFTPQVSACPGCGRTTSSYFQELAQQIQNYITRRMPSWREIDPAIAGLNIAVMGCIVNGPGESKHADIGISLPGTGESPAAPVFIDGKKAKTLRGDTIAQDFQAMLEDYIQTRFAGQSTTSSQDSGQKAAQS